MNWDQTKQGDLKLQGHFRAVQPAHATIPSAAGDASFDYGIQRCIELWSSNGREVVVAWFGHFKLGVAPRRNHFSFVWVERQNLLHR